MDTPLFPMFLDLAERRCLVLGAGPETERKAALLERCGATVIPCARLTDAPPLDDIALVMVVGASSPDTQALADACRRRGIPVNVEDEPRLCSFIMPAIVDRAPVMVAISTSGRSPALAKLLREALDKLLPVELGALGVFAGRFRRRVRHAIADPAMRRSFWRRVLSGPIAVLVLGGREREAETVLREALVAASTQTRKQDAA
jgi:uroporphyrin-III C-methyltransferase / precorrin-2 dehydrogenase / sirohydrochlorin ferrochelatase